MAYVQTDSASGSFLNSAGQTVTYTTTSSVGGLDPLNFAGLDGPALGYEAGSSTSEIHTRVFSEQVNGAQIQMASFSNNAGAQETVTVILDGVVVELDDLISSGQATLTSVEGDVVVTPDGDLEAVFGENVSSIATLTINVPFTSLALDMNMVGNGLGVITEFYVDDTAPPPVCFAAGGLIDTAAGEKPVEALAVGDRIRTLDAGYAALRWIGNRAFDAEALAADPTLRPVRVAAGALGGGLPHRDVWVSRQHRLLLATPVAQRMFGTLQVLVPAIKLVGLPGIAIDESVTDVAYYHFALDRHQIVFVDGAPMESLLLGRESIKTLPWPAQVELRRIFPALCDADFHQPAVRVLPERRKLTSLTRRLIKNSRPILEAAWDVPAFRSA